MCAAHSSSWRLKPLHQEDLPTRIEIDPKEGLTVGRGPANSVVVDGEAHPEVSIHHVRLVVRGLDLVLEDLNSKNGTLVAGERISRKILGHGDVFELGSGGPRFAALESTNLAETVSIDLKRSAETSPKRSLGPETVRLVRARLGIPEGGRVDQMLAKRSRNQVVVLAVIMVILLAGGGTAFWLLQTADEQVAASLEARTDALARQLSVQLARNEQQVKAQRDAWENQRQALESAYAAWEGHKSSLEREQVELETHLQQLQDDEETAASELKALRTLLQENRASLERFSPVNLEQEKLRHVSRVVESVVLIEARQTFREEESKRKLYFLRSESGEVLANFEEEGEEFTNDATGSGFTVTDDGWIITNAHVVHKKEEDRLYLGPDITLVPEIELNVVFTGESRRHPAQLIRFVADGNEDLALLKIEPFEGMPHLPRIDLGHSPPLRGSDVFLLGFPLGKRVIQQGDTMIASTFRGIVSRVLDEYLQVDAAVHPGASGGPLIDGSGNVLGVVVGMQAVDETAGSSAIGYIIPVAKVSAIWPPPTSF
jgi:S1-C subfamily serine protease/pSer/pThr/pTyr-binding forkhead associated (FHA) protein